MSSNKIIYIGNYHCIFARSEQIQLYVLCFMVGVAVILMMIVLKICVYYHSHLSCKQIDLIEQDEPDKMILPENHFRETQVLESGMLRAQSCIAKLMEDVRNEAAMKEKARFDALKAQINPHFLFNTLNAIRWKATINQDMEVAEVLAELGVLLSETYKSDAEMENNWERQSGILES